MKVEQVEPTEDQIIELAMQQTMKSEMSGEDPPMVDEVVVDEPVTEVIEEPEQGKEPEKVEPTIQEQLQAQAEMIAKLTRALDKTNGTYGSRVNQLERKLAEVESQKREVFKSISPAQLKRLTAAYPELAGDLAEDLNEAFGTKEEAKETAIVQPQSDPRIDSLHESTGKLAEQMKQIALTELGRVHNDWYQVAHWETENIDGVGNVIKFENPQFGAWLNKQDQDTKDIVFKGEDIADISKVISAFKGTIKPATPDETTQESSEPKKQTINKKLEKAVLPTGRRTGSHELLTEDEIIDKARQEEQKRIMNGY